MCYPCTARGVTGPTPAFHCCSSHQGCTARVLLQHPPLKKGNTTDAGKHEHCVWLHAIHAPNTQVVVIRSCSIPIHLHGGDGPEWIAWQQGRPSTVGRGDTRAGVAAPPEAPSERSFGSQTGGSASFCPQQGSPAPGQSSEGFWFVHTAFHFLRTGNAGINSKHSPGCALKEHRSIIFSSPLTPSPSPVFWHLQLKGYWLYPPCPPTATIHTSDPGLQIRTSQIVCIRTTQEKKTCQQHLRCRRECSCSKAEWWLDFLEIISPATSSQPQEVKPILRHSADSQLRSQLDRAHSQTARVRLFPHLR